MTTTHNIKPCMIAIEGTKGSGKSTLIEQIRQRAAYFPFKLDFYRPTAPAPCTLPVSRFLSLHPQFETDDEWQEKLYAERARWHSTQIAPDTECIIADRCIATSYATRWQKWKNPMVTINRVDRLHPDVPLPDYIFWLDCPPWLAIERIRQRAIRNYGLRDQSPERIRETYEAYREMIQNPPTRIAHTQWITIKADRPIAYLVELVTEGIIRHYNNYVHNQ